jgi:hypothetical protein
MSTAEGPRNHDTLITGDELARMPDHDLTELIDGRIVPLSPTIVDGFTREQRFFLGFAQIRCESRRDVLERQRALTDPHSSGRYRVNGTVSNMPEFAKAFSCAERLQGLVNFSSRLASASRRRR